MEESFDAISRGIDGFYFGRYDVKAESLQDLEAGKIKIIELNGMGSLPTHIYDPENDMRNAYKELFRHRKIAYDISKKNKALGIPFTSFKEIRKIIKKYGI